MVAALCSKLKLKLKPKWLLVPTLLYQTSLHVVPQNQVHPLRTPYAPLHEINAKIRAVRILKLNIVTFATIPVHHT